MKLPRKSYGYSRRLEVRWDRLSEGLFVVAIKLLLNIMEINGPQNKKWGQNSFLTSNSKNNGNLLKLL